LTPCVHIVVLNWNNCADTVKCVESLARLEYDNFRVTVIDNGSSDDSVAVLSKLDGFVFKRNASNLGYAGGNNVAIRDAVSGGADYVWLLNNDAIVAPDCLARLVDEAERSADIGLVSPVIYFAEEPQRIQHCNTRFDTRTCSFDEAPDIATAREWQATSPGNIAVWGTALLIRRSLIEKIGLLDERLFAYSEDTDYSIRSSAAGFRNVTAFDASIWHHWPSGLRRPYYYYFCTRNDLLMWRKHLSLPRWFKAVWWNLDRAKRTITRLGDQPALIDACLAGFWDGVLGKTGAYLPSRRMPWLVRRLLLGNAVL
jgi:GT2 family glycosyltransferase